MGNHDWKQFTILVELISVRKNTHTKAGCGITNLLLTNEKNYIFFNILFAMLGTQLISRRCRVNHTQWMSVPSPTHGCIFWGIPARIHSRCWSMLVLPASRRRYQHRPRNPRDAPIEDNEVRSGAVSGGRRRSFGTVRHYGNNAGWRPLVRAQGLLQAFSFHVCFLEKKNNNTQSV